jgi:hypothetical protein
MSEVPQYSDTLRTKAQRAALWSDRMREPADAVGGMLLNDSEPLPVRIGKAYLGLAKMFVYLIPSEVADRRFETTLNREVEGLEVHTEVTHIGDVRGVTTKTHYYRLPGFEEFMGLATVAHHIAAES